MGVGNGDDGKSAMDGIFCSICLEAVIDDGDRSWAKLHCGHHFHLVKENFLRIHITIFWGIMLCFPSKRLCHPRPYISYFRPLHLFSSMSTTMSNGSVLDDSSFNSHYTGPSVPNDVASSYAFPSIITIGTIRRYNNPHCCWPRSALGCICNTGIVLISQDLQFYHSFLVVEVRAPLPHQRFHLTQVQRLGHESVYQQLEHIFSNPQTAHVPVVNSSRRSSSHRASAHLAPAAPSSDQQEASGFNFFPLSSSARTFQEGEINPRSEQLNFWELEHHQPLYATTSQGERDYSLIWGPFHPPNGYHQRHGS